MDDHTLPIRTSIDVVLARKQGRQLAKTLGFGIADQTRLATAISELTRNVIQYAGAGTCHFSTVHDASHVEIVITVSDNGPGIPDIERAMSDGYSTGGGLGAGLPGTKRLVHRFVLDSSGDGSRVEIAMRRRA